MEYIVIILYFFLYIVLINVLEEIGRKLGFFKYNLCCLMDMRKFL